MLWLTPNENRLDNMSRFMVFELSPSNRRSSGDAGKLCCVNIVEPFVSIHSNSRSLDDTFCLHWLISQKASLTKDVCVDFLTGNFPSYHFIKFFSHTFPVVSSL